MSVYRLFMTPLFKKFLDGLNKTDHIMVMKAVEKLKQHADRTSFLQWEFAGNRKLKFSKVRIVYRICKECRQLGHDKKYGRCYNCSRQNDVINLIYGDLRGDDTYSKSETDREDAKIFMPIKVKK